MASPFVSAVPGGDRRHSQPRCTPALFPDRPAARDGQTLQPLPTELPDGLWAWREDNGTISVVADGEADGTALIPVTRARDGILHARPTSVLRQGTVVVGQRELLALSMKDEQSTLVALLLADDQVSPQRVSFVGADRSEPVVDSEAARVALDRDGPSGRCTARRTRSSSARCRGCRWRCRPGPTPTRSSRWCRPG